MTKNISIWLAGLSTAALISGAALAETPAQKMDDAAAHTDAAAHETGEAVESAASATGQAAENAAESTGETIQNAAESTGETIKNAASATGEAIKDAANATGEAVQDAGDSMATAANNAKDAVADRLAADDSGTPVPGQMFEQDSNTFLASTLLDATIANMAGEEIGDVNDLVINSDGTVTGVVVGVGGFLGVGEKDVALEMSAVRITTDEDGDLIFSVNETEEALENAPAFVTADEREAMRQRAMSDDGLAAPSPQ